MNFIQFNNNFEPNEIILESGCQDKVRMNTPAQVTVFENCNMKIDRQPVMTNLGNSYTFDDEYPFVEKFDLDEDEKDVKKAITASKENEIDIKKGTILKDAVVILEKLPDDKVQHYLAKEAKNYDIMNFGQKVSSSTPLRSIRKKKYKSSPVLEGHFAKKVRFEADECMKGILSPATQQYLANTEMGYSSSDLTELDAKPQKYSTRVNECTTDTLIKNLCGTDETQHPVQIGRRHQTGNSLQQHFVDMKENHGADNFLNSHIVQRGNIDFSCPKGQESFIDVEKIDDSLQNPENLPDARKVTGRKKIRRKKGGVRRKKNLTSTLCQRICPNCKTYKQQIGKASKKVMCSKCEISTLYECRKCKKQISNYNTMYHHLLYQCEACMLYACAHCKYFVRKKRSLISHIKKEHKRIFFNDLGCHNKSKNTHQGSHPSRQYDNLIVLKKQKEIKSNSEWYIENVKKRDTGVGKCNESSVLKTSALALSSPKPISSLPVPNSTSIVPVSNPTSLKAIFHFYCQYCEKEMDVYGPYNQSEIYCDNCGLTVLIFKCLKCCKTCETYQDMKQHLKKDCTLTFQKKVREIFYCSECNYRSCFRGLVENHYSKMHSTDTVLQEFPAHNSIQNFKENDLDFYLHN